jgi:RNA polymerase sigma-70 factor, ECF subfamily
VTTEHVPDEQLMLRYGEGDVRAFEVLYGRHRGGVFRYVRRQIGLRSAAEEVFQEIWIRIVGARSRYRVEARFATFLYHVAHNCVIDHFRGRPPLQLISLDEDPEESLEIAASVHDQPERAAMARQSARALLQALATLPVEQREAFLLQQEGGLSLDEIAEVTGTGRETVKSRLRYALARLRESMTYEADVA